MLREGGERGKERYADRQAYTHRETEIDRQTDRQTEKLNRHTQRHNPHAYADPGKTGGTEPPPPLPPTPVKSHSCTPKMQTFFTLTLSRATKAIK